MKPSDYCITTVVVGDTYRNLLKIFMRSYRETGEPMPRVLVYTEAPDKIDDGDVRVEKIPESEPLQVNGSFNMSLKRFAFKHAADLGFNKLIFIDIDRIIVDWDFQTILDTTQDGLGTNWVRGVGVPRHDRSSKTKHRKFNAIFNGYKTDRGINLWDRQPYTVFGESLNITSVRTDKLQVFVNEWAQCSSYIQKSELTPKHINVEMSTALTLADINIYKYNPPIDPDFGGKIFRHFGYGKKGQMLEMGK